MGIDVNSGELKGLSLSVASFLIFAISDELSNVVLSGILAATEVCDAS